MGVELVAVSMAVEVVAGRGETTTVVVASAGAEDGTAVPEAKEPDSVVEVAIVEAVDDTADVGGAAARLAQLTGPPKLTPMAPLSTLSPGLGY